MLTLRPYQERAIAALGNAGRKLLVLPTGGGKTEVAAALLQRWDGNGLFLTHRLELVSQAAARIAKYGLRVGVVQGDAPSDEFASVQVASVPTLARRGKIPNASLVITDEAHHAVAGSFENVIARYPDAFHVGLTATPYRLDGRGLGGVFEEIVVAATPRELVDLGYLVPPRIYTAPEPDLSGVRKSMGDYVVSELAARMTKLTGDVVETWKKRAPDRKTVVFAVNIEHSKALAERFSADGISAEHFDGEDDIDTRRAVLQRFASGATQVLCNCSLISEGFDLPEIGCVVMARPTASRALYRQQIGRAMRPAAGKTECILLDNAGNYGRHGDPLADEMYTLADGVRVAERPTPTKICKGCFAVLPAATPKCPYCGYVSPAQTVKITESDEELVEASAISPRYARMSAEERVALYRTLAEQCERCGYKPGWVAYQYRGRFGIWPEPAVRAKAESGTAAPVEALRKWARVAAERGHKPGWVMWQFKNAYDRWPSIGEKRNAGV